MEKRFFLRFERQVDFSAWLVVMKKAQGRENGFKSSMNNSFFFTMLQKNPLVLPTYCKITSDCAEL